MGAKMDEHPLPATTGVGAAFPARASPFARGSTSKIAGVMTRDLPVCASSPTTRNDRPPVEA
ncbi:MAG: hypothetical protein ACKOJF_07120, partial [Planctomycetaceae bacterium]